MKQAYSRNNEMLVRTEATGCLQSLQEMVNQHDFPLEKPYIVSGYIEFPDGSFIEIQMSMGMKS